MTSAPDPLAAELAAIRNAADAATPGPWEPVVDDHGRKGTEHSVWSETAERYVAEYAGSGDDTAFIAQARTAMPRLVAAVEAALALAAEMENQPEPTGGGDRAFVSHEQAVLDGLAIRRAISAALTGEGATASQPLVTWDCPLCSGRSPDGCLCLQRCGHEDCAGRKAATDG